MRFDTKISSTKTLLLVWVLMYTPGALADGFDALMNATGGGGLGQMPGADVGSVARIRTDIKEAASTTNNKKSKNSSEEDDDDDDEIDNKPATIREKAFQQLIDKTFPLRPTEIVRLHEQLEKSKEAVSRPVLPPPHPVSSTMPIDLSPGATSPVVRLAKGFVTSLVFVDATGQPWPIADYTIGNATDFTIQWDNKTNTLFVQSNKNYVHTNLALRMAELDAPIVISFVTNQKEIDYRLDMQLQARGPNAVMPITRELPRVTPQYLVSALDGIPPNGARQLKVSGIKADAWLFNGKMLLRTKYPLLSPAWSSTISSVDGTKVYQIATTPSILVSVDGNPIYATITGM
ncbi:MAG: hypothetical protein HON32_02895 [Francisellaceae bacterium]|jgi:intracellular multiplication protein IcmK|nr:hypothetical protein [Francisellaceae bacterium]MBT6538268.1 hypothetical protein [Francisellaceae bacterium]